MTKENKTELRQEQQQVLTEKAEMIEEAKRVAWAIRHKDQKTQFDQLSEMFPGLSKEEIENILEKA
jgi:hypothetical protein